MKRLLKVGDVVRLRCDADRFPDFIVRAGMTGEVVRADEFGVSVRLFLWHPGAEEWNNEVEWYAREPHLGSPHDELEVIS